jgi:hypothetical protein
VTGQLELLEQELRPLTPRQQAVLDALQRAGQDGLLPAEAGAIVHMAQGRHGPGLGCRWCPTAGLEILRALRKRGLARQRGRPRVWVAVGVPTPDPPGMSSELPEGF